MPLDLNELKELVNEVARERKLDADVIGVTTTEGDGCYAEAIVDIRGAEGGDRRVSVGLQRDAPTSELRAKIGGSFDRALSRNESAL